MFLPGLVDEFLSTLQAAITSGGEVNAPRLAYCEVCCALISRAHEPRESDANDADHSASRSS